MQMLTAGGLPPLTDYARPADVHNPKGYFEFGPVKSSATDVGWIGCAAGKAVKVVHALLPCLPRDRHYRILFARRDLREVVASQRAMLDRIGRRGAELRPARLAEVFDLQARRVLNWAARQPNISLLQVNHRDLVDHPAPQARRINTFLGGALDEAAMAAAVDPTLYRWRLGAAASLSER